MKTSDLTGAALDWAVSKAIQPGYEDWRTTECVRQGFKPSANWAQGGRIIEREGISVLHTTMRPSHAWEASHTPAEDLSVCEFGPAPLIAAMRCYVASKLGDSVDVPEELTEATA